MTGVDSGRRLRIGTRGSALALRQTDRVVERLSRLGLAAAERVIVRTEGDLDKVSPLSVIGGRGVFTSALQTALLRGEIDAAVHSAKDLPTDEPVELALVAFLDRVDPRDVVISRHGLPLTNLPARPTIGTSSRRRATQVLAARPDATIVELRGNVDTRLRKAMRPDLDAIVLAAAGVIRMGLADRISGFLPIETFVPAPGQGALVVEARRDDELVRRELDEIDEPGVATAIRIERAFLRAVGSGCTAPIGAHAIPDGDRWRLLAMLGSDDGRRVEWLDERLDLDAEAHAADAARRLVSVVGATVRAPTTRLSQPPTPRSSLLAGLTVAVTRPPAQAASLIDALRAHGATPVAVPTIRIEPPADPAPLERATRSLAAGEVDWLVVTSANAVESLRATADRLGLRQRAFAAARIAAIGAATAEAVHRAGGQTSLVPAEATGEALVAALIERDIGAARVLLPQGNLARPVVGHGLAAAGARVEVVEAYRTVEVDTIDPALRRRFERGAVDLVSFASPSSVRGLIRLLGGVDALAGVEAVCVGSTTAATAREVGLTVAAVAGDPSTDGLVQALIAHRARQAVPPDPNGRNRRDRRTATSNGASPADALVLAVRSDAE